MLQVAQTQPDDAAAQDPPTTVTKRSEWRKAGRLRSRKAAGRQISDAQERWLAAYEERSPWSAAAARRRGAGKVDIAQIIRAVAALYRRRDEPRLWRAVGTARDTEPRRVLVWLLRRLGVTTHAIESAVNVGSVIRMVRTAEKIAAADPDVRRRMDLLLDGFQSGPVSWADGIVGMTRGVRSGRRTVTLEIEVGSELWRLIDRWSEAHEIGFLAVDNRNKPDSLAAEGARQ